MSKLLSVFATATLVFALAGCSKDEAAKSEKPAAADEHAKEAGGGHASADVEPGSHADWCGEHGVPESQCTRCNPELAAAFKATGDWCDDHGMPESQCLKCNPDLKIVRPPPADGDKSRE